jgi:hypothetical protein
MIVENPSRMEAVRQQEVERLSQQEVKSAEFIAGGSTAEAIGGAGAVVLAILGLVGILPLFLAAIASIAIGGALLVEGAAIAARYTHLLRESHPGHGGMAELGGGMTIEFIAGCGGVVLGILALLKLAPITLLAIAVLGFAGGLLFGSGATSRVDTLGLYTGRAQHVAYQAVNAAAGTQALVGLGIAVLGILALVGMMPLTLILVGLLAAGGAVLLTGGALAARMMSLIHH